MVLPTKIKTSVLVLLLTLLIFSNVKSQIVINEIDMGSPDGVELFNPTQSIIQINNWKLKTGDDERVQTYPIPSFSIDPGKNILLLEGSNSNTQDIKYLGISDIGFTNINWSNSTAGAVELKDENDNTIDFISWGSYSSMTTSETNWSGDNIPLPIAGTNLGRDINSTDTNNSSDIMMQVGSLGKINNSPPIFSNTQLMSGFLGQKYLYQVKAIGPAGPFTYEIVSGNLPNGLNLESDGTIHGTVNETGNFIFYLRASDSQTPPKSALEIFTLNTYDFNLTFDKSILLVNGVDWGTYNDMIRDSYANKTFWSDYKIDFWDCFETPTNGYPVTLPEVQGHGAIPFDVLGQYSLVIWIGNDYNGDLEVWQNTPIFDYVKLGGNLMLLTRRGQNFLDENFRNYLGIQWREDEENTISNCLSVYPGLQNIQINPYNSSGHTLVAVFSTLLADEESTLLFKETQSFNYHRGLGVWKKPKDGGQFRSSGGQVVFLCGRPYSMDSNNLRTNMEFMINNFFNISSVKEDDYIPMEFSLNQNYPNPFNSETNISFNLPKTQEIILEIYDVLGKKIETLLNETKSPGYHELIWNSNSNTSGIYYLKITSGDQNLIRKMIYLQ